MSKKHFQWLADATDENSLASEKPSRSEKKRRALDLQKLGEKLAKNQMLWDTLALPDALSSALRDNLRLTSHEAQRRQLQYIGRLMRELPEETLTKIKNIIRHGEQKFS
ncbi:MAG: DUF615 domain-containing protein [Desulfovibrio sp.]|nr:DUF615 domain-containing protein [Desulfovibrio sp.]